MTTLEDALDVLALAPFEVASVGRFPRVGRLDLWKLYTAKADLTGYTARAIRRIVGNLQPDVAGLIVIAWAMQVDLDQYKAGDLADLAKVLPASARAALQAEYDKRGR